MRAQPRPRQAVVHPVRQVREDDRAPATSTAGPVSASPTTPSVPIRDKIIERAPRTLSLARSARRSSGSSWASPSASSPPSSAGRSLDRVAMGFALFGISAPVFWLGLMALFIFWYKLGLTPGTGYVPFTREPEEWFIAPDPALDRARPALRGDLRAHDARQPARRRWARTTSARRAPRACPSAGSIFKHGLRASLTPIVTMFGIDFALLRRRRDHHRERLQPRRPRLHGRRLRLPQDLPAMLGVVLVGDLRGRDHEPHRRHRLRLPRSARALP